MFLVVSQVVPLAISAVASVSLSFCGHLQSPVAGDVFVSLHNASLDLLLSEIFTSLWYVCAVYNLSPTGACSPCIIISEYCTNEVWYHWLYIWQTVKLLTSSHVRCNLWDPGALSFSVSMCVPQQYLVTTSDGDTILPIVPFCNENESRLQKKRTVLQAGRGLKLDEPGSKY